jgi:TonB family protein
MTNNFFKYYDQIIARLPEKIGKSILMMRIHLVNKIKVRLRIDRLFSRFYQKNNFTIIKSVLIASLFCVLGCQEILESEPEPVIKTKQIIKAIQKNNFEYVWDSFSPSEQERLKQVAGKTRDRYKDQAYRSYINFDEGISGFAIDKLIVSDWKRWGSLDFLTESEIKETKIDGNIASVILEVEDSTNIILKFKRHSENWLLESNDSSTLDQFALKGAEAAIQVRILLTEMNSLQKERKEGYFYCINESCYDRLNTQRVRGMTRKPILSYHEFYIIFEKTEFGFQGWAAKKTRPDLTFYINQDHKIFDSYIELATFYPDEDQVAYITEISKAKPSLDAVPEEVPTNPKKSLTLGEHKPLEPYAKVAYQNELQAHVKSGWRWMQRSNHLRTLVEAKIRPDGEITNVQVLQGSGNSNFDDSVVRALKKASPAPPPPREFYADFATVGFWFDSND